MDYSTDTSPTRPTSKQIVKRKKLQVSIPVGNGFRYAFLDAAQLADICRVSKSHAYRWIKGSVIIPDGYMDLIKIKALGLIPDRQWWGWCVKDSQLISPEGYKFNPEELDQVQMVRDENRFSQQEIQKLTNQVNDTKEMFYQYCQGQKDLVALEQHVAPKEKLFLSHAS